MTKSAYTTLCLFVVWFWSFCYGFVLLSSAAGAGGVPIVPIFKPGHSWDYELHSTILLNEKDGPRNKSVGFSISGDVRVESVWGSANEKILKFQIMTPKLSIRSRKAPAPDGFIEHTSKLDSFKNPPFYVHWNKGRIEKILLSKDETLAFANIKKGIASLFQFQLLDQETKETDSSGHCTAKYTTLGPDSFEKSKFDCLSPDFVHVNNPDEILNTKTVSRRTTRYDVSSDEFLSKIESTERHLMYLNVKEDVGNEIEASQTLVFARKGDVIVYDADNVEDALEKIRKNDHVDFTQESLITERENSGYDDKRSFSSAVGDYRNALKAELLGTLLPAKAFINLVTLARKSTKEDITKALGSKKNKNIMHQLYDVLGYVQTKASHESVMKKLHFDDQNQEELSERYLWALSFSSQPNPEIIDDLLGRFKKTLEIPEKVKETLILTIASMTRRLVKLSSQNTQLKIVQKVEEEILNSLDYAKGSDRLVFLRALRNLESKNTITKLLEIVTGGTLKEAVLAWRAISAIDPQYLGEEVFRSAIRTFYQIDKKYDSSARTLAVDVILEMKPKKEVLQELIYHLASSDSAFEVKQYLWQKLKMYSERDEVFRNEIDSIIRKDPEINNYNVLGQKGLSTALSRSFVEGPSSNGSLLTVQEIFGGIVKRGVVNIVMEKRGASSEIFSLGIFSGGLSSFLSSDTEGDSEETAVAGMEISVLGTPIRPFTFFSGQGELMGHVWSGTASERTTAYQALAMLHDHLEYLRLGPGFIAELDTKGGTSFDLSGKIEISLWNRNAESLVEKSAGIVVVGFSKIDTEFVRSQVEFSVSLEPRLSLQTDIDFSSNVALCMRLTQPENTLRHNVYKIERIPGSKHRLRMAKYKKNQIPGKTYALNKKNNDMCTSMFGLA